MADRSNHAHEVRLPSGASPLSRKNSANGRSKPVKMTEEDVQEMLRAFPRQTKPNTAPKRLIHGYWG
jgi:hypothetical protein